MNRSKVDCEVWFWLIFGAIGGIIGGLIGLPFGAGFWGRIHCRTVDCLGNPVLWLYFD